MAHPPELKQRARDLRKQGVLVRVIAIDLGVPKATVTRWTNPDHEKRERQKARKRKYKTKKMCAKCKTKRVSSNATFCRRCYLDSQRFWTAEKIVEAIQDWAIEHGHPPSWTDWQRSGKGHPALGSITDGPRPPFTKWSDALVAAGFEPWVRRARRGRKPLTEARKRQRANLRRRVREEKLRKAVEKENGNDDAGSVRADADLPGKAGGVDGG